MQNIGKKKNKHKRSDEEKKKLDERWEQFIKKSEQIDSDGNFLLLD